MTRLRHFCLEHLFVLSNCPWCTPVLNGPWGYFFRLRKIIWILHFYVFQNEPRSQIHFWFTIWNVEKTIGFPVHDCFVDIFHNIFKCFLFHPFKFRIHHEMLIWTQLFFEIQVMHIVGDIVRINLCCANEKTIWVFSCCREA